MLAALLTALLAGCDTPDSASAAAERWLRAAAGAEEDRGWAMLDPNIRFGVFEDDPTEYVEAASNVDWDAVSWTVETARSIGSGQVSVMVALDDGGSEALTAFIRERHLAFPWCRGDELVGLRLIVSDFDGESFIGLGFFDGEMPWPCDGDGDVEPEFVASREQQGWGNSLVVWNNTELSLVVSDDLERDIVLKPCEQVPFESHGRLLTIAWEDQTVGTVELEAVGEGQTQFVVVGQREIYSGLTPPQEPIPFCGGVPESIQVN